jgi:hypothetical protein
LPSALANVANAPGVLKILPCSRTSPCLPLSGLRPSGWTVSSDCFNRLPVVSDLELREAEVVQRRVQALEVELSRMVQECGGSRVADRRVIEVLVNQPHAHCLSPDHHDMGL